ncbi:MAG: DNA-binding protein VF530 [Helicobacteraceae bacterium]|nr:DNA-binding protein VF530 [Helicobacteraceae bacterium]
MENNPNNPLHGLKLKDIVTSLVEKYGFEELDKRFKMNCFSSKPSINSTLKFLRKTDWARAKIEKFYLETFK